MCDLPKKLKQIFSVITKDLEISDYSIEIERAPKVAIGYIGRIAKVTLKGFTKTCEMLTLPLICKYPPDDPEDRSTFNSMECFQRECYFYNNVIPEFEKLQTQLGITNSTDGFYSYPKCYYANYDHFNNTSFIILEDLTNSGFDIYGTISNPTNDINQVKLLFHELAKMHALSFALKLHKPYVLEKFKSFDNILSRALSTKQLAPIAVRNCQLALEILEPTETDKINLITKMSPHIWDKVREISDWKLSEPYNVLGHGDIYANNMMFRFEVRHFYF